MQILSTANKKTSKTEKKGKEPNKIIKIYHMKRYSTSEEIGMTKFKTIYKI